MATKKKPVLRSESSIAIQPLGDRIVVAPETKEEKTSVAGIIIPETVDKEKPAKGKVVAVGPGKYEDGKLVPTALKPGQMVLFSKYGYDEVKVDGKEYFILSESQVLAVIK
jgi:chaperonin GroES